MHSLIVVIFEEKDRAEEFRLDCRKNPAAEMVDCAKMVVAVREPGGEVHLQYNHTLAKDGAFIGGIWGALIGLMLLNPILGVVAGAGIGAGIGELGDFGIGKDFLSRLASHLKPGTSALFIPVPSALAGKVSQLLQSTDGIVLQTQLDTADEKELEHLLENHIQSHPVK